MCNGWLFTGPGSGAVKIGAFSDVKAYPDRIVVRHERTINAIVQTFQDWSGNVVVMFIR